jgi:hypothetical protein
VKAGIFRNPTSMKSLRGEALESAFTMIME